MLELIIREHGAHGEHDITFRALIGYDDIIHVPRGFLKALLRVDIGVRVSDDGRFQALLIHIADGPLQCLGEPGQERVVFRCNRLVGYLAAADVIQRLQC